MNRTVQSGNESELISAILAGDAQLYHQLIRPYERSIYVMSLSYMKNEKDAEDVAQETFIKAFRDLCTFRGHLKFKAWLISIAINEVRNRLWRQSATQIVSLDKSQGEEMPVLPALLRDWKDLPSDVVECEEARRLLRQAVEMLPSIEQQVFLLRDAEELSANDTAQILDINTSQVKVSLHRARMMLQRFLAPKLKVTNSV